jgi:uncharacterized membrane protein
MSDLLVLGFDGNDKARQVLAEIQELERENLVDLEDAAIVVHDKKGKIKIEQTHNLAAASASGGFWWGGFLGLILGWIVLNPILGWALGAGLGSGLGWWEGKSIDLGINDEFMKKLGETLEPNSSAIFVLIRKATLDRVIEDLKPFGGTLLHTSLSFKDEQQLKQAIEGTPVTTG